MAIYIIASRKIRKLHEKNLLGKIADVETKLNGYLDNLAKTINDVKTGISNIKIPTLDMDAVIRNIQKIIIYRHLLITIFLVEKRYGSNCFG